MRGIAACNGSVGRCQRGLRQEGRPPCQTDLRGLGWVSVALTACATMPQGSEVAFIAKVAKLGRLCSPGANYNNSHLTGTRRALACSLAFFQGLSELRMPRRLSIVLLGRPRRILLQYYPLADLNRSVRPLDFT